MTDIPIITVDGPSGTGKGTLCRFLAQWLAWHILDSGALYRIVAYLATNQNIDLDDEARLTELAARLAIHFESGPYGVDIIDAEGRDISDSVRTESNGNAASCVAALQRVREALLQRQRDFLRLPGLVADGRDMGTVVFPHAPAKFFLTASPEERARRRYKQLNEKGISVNLPRLSAEISERDARDRARSVSPLIPAEDAIIIDSTELDISGVCAKVAETVSQIYQDIPSVPSDIF